jgi:hypothetical protein
MGRALKLTGISKIIADLGEDFDEAEVPDTARTHRSGNERLNWT